MTRLPSILSASDRRRGASIAQCSTDYITLHRVQAGVRSGFTDVNV
jgi:hypothetical protein